VEKERARQLAAAFGGARGRQRAWHGIGTSGCISKLTQKLQSFPQAELTASTCPSPCTGSCQTRTETRSAAQLLHAHCQSRRQRGSESGAAQARTAPAGPARSSSCRALWGQSPDRSSVFPEVTDDFIAKETVFATTCHKISSLPVATQKWGSTVITATFTSGSEARGAAGGFWGQRGDTNATAAADGDCRDRHLCPPHARFGLLGAGRPQPLPPPPPAHTPHIPPTAGSGCRSRRWETQAVGTGRHFSPPERQRGCFGSRTAPAGPALVIGHPGQSQGGGDSGGFAKTSSRFY